ncbi:MAG: bifunctional folylpolyglutamate synthase/dihydrofolate synthase, partial [Candidatus Omnitrophica bacterium]|nr:bifunctional folylpolyglutamate synthase/dihydrofolate synthase [Candidatus Omnitrophota bacterium]
MDRIKTLANLFGNPQNYYPAIHITGTKGKGSAASILSHILTESGFNVGLYTSPHIISLRERLKINNRDIEKKELANLVSELKTKIKKLGPSFKPSFFEIYTLLAFNYFKRKRVDFGIFEVGMGGRFDATNVIQPIVSGITSISYDHTEELGKQLTNIAREKAGIIKEGVDCISAPQQKQVLKVIKD